MRRVLCPILIALLVAVGCGPKLSGRYEADMPLPDVKGLGVSPQHQAQVDAAVRSYKDMSRMVLEFRGSKARLGDATMLAEYRYRVTGNRLELYQTIQGQKITINMTIHPDGSIGYLGVRFRKR